MNIEQEILNAFERGKGFGIAEGMKMMRLKELTDEEIMVLYEEYIETQYASESNVLGFGRAILRKAQEK
jgi:hypothetical protein